jgi:glycine dehydrogenase subunit 2
MTEPTIYDLSSPGRVGVQYPEPDVPPSELPQAFLRAKLPLPELSEVDVVRHFTKLSKLNYSIDEGIYPLGSCTMKYNPRINEETARLPGFTLTHPLQPVETIQGNLALMYQLQDWLAEIIGMKSVSLQPAAGAHGEFTGVSIIRKYHAERGDTKRTRMLVPDSAHGTNPATITMAGFEVVNIPSDARGNVDLEALRTVCDDTVAGLMITNPNTLGLFDEHICEVTELIHACGGLVYGDGANLNALMGIAKPAELGIDIMHFNLHKTFSTPHGGGGPGSGPVGVVDYLADYLPGPIVVMAEEGDEDNPPYFDLQMPAKSIGRVKSFWGHFGVLIRAFTYISMHGNDGLRKVTQMAVLNANYVLALIRDKYNLAYDRICMHEFVLEGQWKDAPGVHALDIAKRLMDYGVHPPTNYFPLIVPEALMIEPTESESKQSLDAFAAALNKIADEAKTDPDLLHSAPHNTPLRRLDEVKAARDLVMCCWLPDRE